MDINKKNRSDLKSYFVKNSVPTESNFADLIDAGLNQKDDGIVKLPGDPLSIEAAGDVAGLLKVINFYAKFQDNNPAWSLQLNPRTDPNAAATAKAGLGVVDGSGATRLFIDKATGNLGIGTLSPQAGLTVVGTANISNGNGWANANGKMASGSLTLGGITANYGGGSNWTANTAALLLETLANTEIAVNDANTRVVSLMYYEGDAANRITIGRDMGWGVTPVTIANNLIVKGAMTPSAGATETNGILFPKDPAGGSGDAAWLRYYARAGESMTLELGINNDADDHIALMPSGNVGIGKNNPVYSLDVSASRGIKLGLEGYGGGQLILKNNKDDNKIYLEAFSKDGAGSAAELLLTGKDAASVPKLSFIADVTNIRGNVGIGLTVNPIAELDIAQVARSGAHPAAVKGLYITGDFGPDADGIEFRHSNATQGIGFGYNTIYAAGSNANQELQLKAKGAGNVRLLGNVVLGGFAVAEVDEWPKVTWYRDTANNWDEGLIKHGPSRGFFGRSGFGIHLHSSRDWTFFSTGWDPLLGVEGGTGNTKIKGNLTVSGAITPSAGNAVTDGIMFPKDPAGGGGDAAWLRYYARAGESMTLELGTSNDPDDHIALMPSGNVGVGTIAPSQKLIVQGNWNGGKDADSGMQYGGQFAIKGNAPQLDFIDTDHNDWSIHVNSNRMYFIREPWSYTDLVLDGAGSVGIGTDSPTQAKLVVRGAANLNLGGYGYLNRNGAGTYGAVVASYSIYADNRVAAAEFNSFSDARIKSIQGRSDNAMDLQVLLGIEITDYCYKDVIGKGDVPHKKVIAQQVEQVFPQAVSKHTDVVPDIYQQASFMDGWVELATDLKEGERVRLISDKTDGVYEVLKVTKDKFRTDFKPEGDTVFVFGREVNDFGNVDYDAIAMLNVSATQQIKKEMDALKAENEALKVRLDALEAKIH